MSKAERKSIPDNILRLTAAMLFAGLLSACSSWDYQGEERPALPPDSEVAFFSDRESVPADFQPLGKFTYVSPAAAGADSVSFRKELRVKALENGANGVLLLHVRRIADGEARQDQLNNTQAPGWNTEDNSATSYSYTVNTIQLSGENRDPGKNLFKTEVEGELLRGPDIVPEKP